MKTYPAGARKCDRSHPIDGPRCLMCEQEDRDQEERDDKLLAALQRIAKRRPGDVRALLEEVLSFHD